MATRPNNSKTFLARPVRGIIFDMDGVIVDTRTAHRDAWAAFAAKEGVTIDPEEFITKTFGRGNPEILAELFPGRELGSEYIRTKSVEKEEMFLEVARAGGVDPIAGLLEFVHDLSAAGLKLSVGSSAPRRNIDVVLDQLGIADKFQVIVSSDDVHRAKPDPAIFLRCCEGLGLLPAEVIVFEDSVHGLEAARRAGCIVAGLSTYHPAEMIAPLSDVVLADFVGAFGRFGDGT